MKKLIILFLALSLTGCASNSALHANPEALVGLDQSAVHAILGQPPLTTKEYRDGRIVETWEYEGMNWRFPKTVKLVFDEHRKVESVTKRTGK